MRFSVSLLLAGSLLISFVGCKKSPPANAVDDGANWAMYGRTNDEQRFSPLSQINEQNIGRLGLAWSKELGTTRGLEATPLVSNGVIYTTGEWSVAFALIYAGTGNGVVWYRDLRSPGGGDNLYIASILALRPSTGELVWYYQVTPGDNWDYDATQPLMLADLKIGGAVRKVIMQASKNGFFYVLDRQNGQFLSAKQFVHGVTWAGGIDPQSGRPIESPTAYHGLDAVLVSPAPGGAHNWYPMAFDPTTGLVYVPAREGSPALHTPDKHWTSNTTNWNRGEDAAYDGPLVAKYQSYPKMTGHLIAWNPVEQRAVWNVTLPLIESGGVLATAGNLVFQGRSDGMFCAYRATDGKKLWEFYAGTGIMAPPVTYLLDGVQYITLMVGWGGSAGINNLENSGPVKPGYGRVVTFSLGGNAKLGIPPFGHQGPPSPAIHMKTTPAILHEGQILYARQCFYCHGVGAISGSGVPDLRYATAATYHQFASIVLGGARQQGGMPSFQDALKPDEVRAIEAYILSRAAAAAQPPASKGP